MRPLRAWALVVCLAVLLAGGCSGPGTQPSPPPGNSGNGGGGNQTPPANNAPVIESITVQGTRLRQPASFADLGESIAVSARVRDDETAADQLLYTWTATTGTFTGTGANVTWQAPTTAPAAVQGATPATVTLTLTITEKYGHPGVPPAFEQSVAKTAPVALHDSAREVGEMARQFLLDFSDSTIRDVAYIMRNFEPGCYGTQEETNQVSDNRKNFFITKWTVGPPTVILNFGGIGPFRGQKGDAFTAIDVRWESKVLAGGTDTVFGVDWIAAYYYPDQKRWRLCDSQFDGFKGFRGFVR